jgi:N-acetylmuramoyl-L-alanine amidase
MTKGIIARLFLLVIIVAGIWYIVDHHSFQSVVKATSNSVTNSPADNTSSTSKKIRVLIVPGHEPDNGGTNYGNIYERTLVVGIGQDFQQFLGGNSRYQSFITRDTQVWNPTFATYFQDEWNQIISWEKTAKTSWTTSTAMNQSGQGEISNVAATDDAMRLYGIVKWADENNIDLMIHMHLNNYPDAMAKKIVGKYSGLVMYVPAPDLANSVKSLPIAEAVFKRLSLYNPISNLPVESQGLETDDSLIAMGAYNTAEMASILIEYDYIYEPQFVNPEVRPIALKDFAYQTYLGVQDYYNNNQNVTATSSYDPNMNVYAWSMPVTSAHSHAEDIYAMQTALIMDGDYPPKGMTRNDCPHSGAIGSCTELAVKAFQQKYHIIGENTFGAKTFTLLHNIYTGKTN